MKIAILGSGVLAAVMSASLLGAPAVADSMASPDPMMMIDCSKTSDMMMMPDKMTPAMTGDVDKDTTAMAAMHMKAMMMMANVEVKCGKDPKMKAAAMKMIETVHNFAPTLNWPLIETSG